MKTIKRIKLCLIAFFAIVFASMSCAFVATSVKHAEAATENEVKVLKSEVFAMDDSGLTLRTNDDKVGIRFKVKMSKNLGVNIQRIEDVSLKFLIAPRMVVDSVNGNYSQLVTAAENTTEGQPARARISVADKNKIYEDGGYYWASLVIANTTGTNIKLDMNVVAYITYTDEKNAAQITRYATTNVEKVRGNLYNVVNSCAVINGYAEAIIGNKNFDWYGTETYPIKITTTKQAADLKKSGVSLSGKTVLSSVDFAGTGATVKTVTEHFVDENIQEIVLGGSDNDTYAIEGMGVYDGTVEKATIGGVVVNYDNNGNVKLLPEFKNRLAKHGEQTLSVTVKGADGNYTEYKKKLLVVTKEISSLEELKAALAFDSNNVKYGYYRLATDLIGYDWYESKNGIGGGIWKNESGDTGFRGTLDGNGFTIRETFWNTGLFGYIGNGAVIKNITLSQAEYVGGRMILGYSMVGAKLKNVKINVKGKGTTAIPTTVSNGKTVGVVGGLLTAIFAHSNDFENVVVDAKDTDVDTLFGSCVYYGYPTGYEANRFTNCDVIAKSIIGLACTDNAEGIKGNASAFILSADNLSVGEISGTPWVDTVYIVLSPNQKTYTVNLKSQYVDYTNATVLSAIWGEEAVTYENGKLTFTDEIITNKQKHGSKTLSVLLKQRGKYYNVKTQVILITKEISDIGTLTAALTPDEGSNAVYGYYRLSKKLDSAGWYSVGYAEKWTEEQKSNPEFGFRGTFDGNDNEISSWFYKDGLFGVVGKGAVIKNLTINNKQYQGNKGGLNTLFGYSMMGATMDKVTVNILSGGRADIDTNNACGLLTCLGGYGNNLKNVTINAKGLAIDTLFGTGCGFTYPKNYEPNKFDTCSITAKSLIGLAYTDKVVTYDNVSGLTVTLEA